MDPATHQERPETKKALGRFTLEPEAARLLGNWELHLESGFSCFPRRPIPFPGQGPESVDAVLEAS